MYKNWKLKLNDIMISKNWNCYLENFQSDKFDIYFCEQYVKLYESQIDEAESFIFHDSSKYFIFPYLKRKISILSDEYYDFETAYGYGGPIVNTNDESFIRKAQLEFYESCERRKIIAGFVRFHPLLNNYQYLNSISKVFFDRKTVAVDLIISEEDIWKKEIHSKHRNVIRKAQNLGLVYDVDSKFSYINEFIELYHQTMQRVNADSSYLFSNKYYNNLLKNLKNNSFLGIVKFNNKIISSAIFFFHNIYGHYHLSGSNESYLSFFPNNYLIYKTALYLKSIGVKILHLGGGLSSKENDGLFRFKNRFSSKNYDFYLGKIIFNSDIYREACKIWENSNPEKKEKYKCYLLKYRY